MRVSDYLNQTNPISKMLEEVVGGKVEASSHRFLWQKKKSPATREIPGPHLQCRGWCAAEFGPWIGPFLQCLGSRQPNGFPKSRGGNIKLVQRKFHECTQNQDIENVYQINESMPSSPTNSAMATAFGSQFGLMRVHCNIWKKGLLLNSYISIFFFRLGQSFPVSSTDCFTGVFSHMTLGVHRYVACAQWPCNISTARCRAPSHRSLPLPCGTWQQEMTADKHRKLSGTQLLRRWMWFVES